MAFGSSIRTVRTLLPAGLAVLTLSAFSQDGNPATIDSLRKLIGVAHRDSSKITLMFKLSDQYRASNLDSTIAIDQRAFALARELHRIPGTAWAAYRLADEEASRSKDWKVVEYYLTAIDAFRTLDDRATEAQALEALARYYGQILYDFPRSIDAYQKANLIWTGLKDREGLAGNLGGMGDQLVFMNEHTKAIDYMGKALAMHQELHDSARVQTDYWALGRAYSWLPDLPKALEYTHKSLDLAQARHDQWQINFSNFLLGKIYVDDGQYEKAIPILEVCRSYSDSVGEPDHNRGIGLWFLARAYAGIHERDKAMALLQESILIGRRTDDLNLQQGTYKEMSSMFENEGRYREALAASRQYDSVYEMIVSGEKTTEIARKEMRFDFDKKQLADSLNLAHERQVGALRLQRQRTIAYGGIIGSGVFAIFLVVLYRQRNNIAKEHQRSEELLLNILPAETAEELKAHGSAKARSYDLVTVMFTDFKNFTEASERMSPEELVQEIDLLYREFDTIIGRHTLEKIKTIGDSYMCAGGLPVSNTTNPVDVVQAALEIRDFMKAHRAEREHVGMPWFDIRIGVHTGPVVAGIVGIKKFAYDIWGDTVNTASRMESSGAVGQVNISGTTHELVKHRFICTPRGMIHAKNKGEIHMYFVEG